MDFGNLSGIQNAVHEGRLRGIFLTGTVSLGSFLMKRSLYPGLRAPLLHWTENPFPWAGFFRAGDR